MLRDPEEDERRKLARRFVIFVRHGGHVPMLPAALEGRCGGKRVHGT